MYFVTIHPYTDGNGRIARALAVKSISEYNNEPTLISLSHAISDSKNEYYDALKKATKDHDVNAWLEYFCKTTVRAQEITKEKIYFAVLSKMHQKNKALNARQLNAINAMIESRYGVIEGRIDIKDPDKFSVSNYIGINRESLKAAKNETGISEKQIAEAELMAMNEAGVIEQVHSNGGVRYRLCFPDIEGLDKYIKPPHRPSIGTLRSQDSLKIGNS